MDKVLGLNGYSSIYSDLTYKNLLSDITSGMEGELSSGQLVIKESSGGRLLPVGIFARWSK